jgi:hypothetical protein
MPETRCCLGCGRDTSSHSGYCYRCYAPGDKVFGHTVSRQYRQDTRSTDLLGGVPTMMEEDADWDDSDATSSQRYHGTMRDDL